MSILGLLTTLPITQPSTAADPDVLTAWLDAKAELLQMIAEEHGEDAGDAKRLAERARRRATVLRNTGQLTPRRC